NLMKNSEKIVLLFVAIFICQFAIAQSENAIPESDLPYYEIPEYSKEYTAGSVAARMVDALGFRFYWSSEGLRQVDLDYKPNPEARSTKETIDHILDLSYIIVNSTLKLANGKNESKGMDFNKKRAQVLINLKTAADLLRGSNDISEFEIIFGNNRIPFWNQVNGPIADAIWHTGQLASFRRTSGNPINPNINHFRGTVNKKSD
ncbi:MAG: hypothetical protein AAF688_15150, partial [Bacteroidota bacterium]